MSDTQPPITIEDRRVNDPIAPLLQLVKQVHANQIALDAKLTAHMTSQTVELADAITTLMSEAFPEGDSTGHRAYHLASIKKAEAQAKFWETMKTEIVKYGLLGFLTWGGVYLWRAFLMGPKP